jgi:lysophospholipid acyltransferase
MLLTIKDSLVAWSRLGWYGNIIIFGALALFYGGGTKYFKRLQKEKGIVPPVKPVPANGNGAATPVPGLAAPLDNIIRPSQN